MGFGCPIRAWRLIAGVDETVPAAMFPQERNRSSAMADFNVAEPSSDATFIRRVFIVISIGILIATLWVLTDILLLLFGSVLVAVILHAAASPLQTYLHFGPRISLIAASLLILGIVALASIVLGPMLADQMRALFNALPAATNRLTTYFGVGSVADLLKEGTAASTLGGLASRIVVWSTTIIGAFGSFLLVVFGGIYLAIDPRLYRDGLVKLVPPAVQANVVATLDDAATALSLWLRGQVIAMLLVGALTGCGLWLAGVPSAIALGFIAGLAEFVPLIGPIVSAIPILLIAGSQDWQTFLLALAVVVVVQQVEGNIITPMIANHMISIAPVVGLFAVVATGVLFGPLGLLLGFPLAIVFDVAVRRLYIRETLGKSVEIPGEGEGEKRA